MLRVVICTVVAALMLTAFSLRETAQLKSCKVTANEFNETAKLLESVNHEKNLEQRRRMTKRAMQVIEELAKKTRECGCEKPTANLNTAAAHLRHAREVGSYRQIATYVHRAIDEINTSADSMETCGLR